MKHSMIMNPPKLRNQLRKLHVTKQIVVSALKQELFQQWLDTKEDTDEVGLTNTGSACPLNTYLQAVLNKQGYHSRVYVKEAGSMKLVPVTKAGYQLHIMPEYISYDDSSMIDGGFEIEPPHWASTFMIEVDKLANTPEIPDEENHREIPVTKADCVAILKHINIAACG